MPDFTDRLAQPAVAELSPPELAVYLTLAHERLRRNAVTMTLSIRRRTTDARKASLQDLIPSARPGAAMHHEVIGRALHTLRRVGLVTCARSAAGTGATDGPGTPYRITVLEPAPGDRPAWGKFAALMIDLAAQRLATASEIHTAYHLARHADSDGRLTLARRELPGVCARASAATVETALTSLDAPTYGIVSARDETDGRARVWHIQLGVPDATDARKARRAAEQVALQDRVRARCADSRIAFPDELREAGILPPKAPRARARNKPVSGAEGPRSYPAPPSVLAARQAARQAPQRDAAPAVEVKPDACLTISADATIFAVQPTLDGSEERPLQRAADGKLRYGARRTV